MRRSVFIAMLLIVAAVAYGQFQGQQWGDSVEIVIDNQGKPYQNLNGRVIYTGTLLGAQSIKAYIFEDDSLVKGTIYLSNPDETRVVKALETRYGEVEHGVHMWTEGDTGIFLHAEGEDLVLSYWYEPWMQEQIEEDKRREEERRQQDAEAF